MNGSHKDQKVGWCEKSHLSPIGDEWPEPFCSLPGLLESPGEAKRIGKNKSIIPPIQGPAKCSFCLQLMARGGDRADCQGAHLGPSSGT